MWRYFLVHAAGSPDAWSCRVFKKTGELPRRAACLNGTIMRCGACAQEKGEGQNIRLEEVHGVAHGHWLVRIDGR